jgi:hypothetical protein
MNYLPLLCLACIGCAPYAVVKTDPAGNPHITVSGGTAHKLQEGIIRAKKGDAEVEMILTNADGTEVPKQVSADLVTYGLARIWGKRDMNKDNVEGSVQKNQSNNDLKALESNNAKETTLGTFQPTPE